MRISKLACALVGLLAVLQVQTASAATIIDDFTVGSSSLQVDSGTGNINSIETGLDSAHVLNGQRKVTLQGNISVGNVTSNVLLLFDGRIRYTTNNANYNVGCQGQSAKDLPWVRLKICLG